jgi:hypothetical protein
MTPGSGSPGACACPCPIDGLPADLIGTIKAADHPVAMSELERIFNRGIRFLLVRKGVRDVDAGVRWVLDAVVRRARAGEVKTAEEIPALVRMAVHDYARATATAEQAALVTCRDAAHASNSEVQRALRGLLKLSAGDREAVIRFYLLEQPAEKICSDLHLTESEFVALRANVRAQVRGAARKPIMGRILFKRVAAA